MGVYAYTLRKNTVKATRDLGDVGQPVGEIGYIDFAYKLWFGWDEPGYYRQQVGRSLAAAERAREANPELDLVVWGDPRKHDFSQGPMTVFQVSTSSCMWYDTQAPGKDVGYLYKNGRKYEFKHKTDIKEAA
jgi:hypothetical protein